MPGVQSPNFCFTWKVENVHLSNRKMNAYFATPVFQVGHLQNTMWQMRFAPAGFGDPLHMGCSLGRMSSEREDAEPEVVKLRWTISVIAEGGAKRFETSVTPSLNLHTFYIVPRFIRKSELLPADTPQNNLTIYCEMTNDLLFNREQDLKYDLDTLSSDLKDLLESGFRSDFTMYCRGEIFKVHKYILLSRWPEFCKRLEIDDIKTRLDIIMTGIEASTLKAFLTFLYTGQLQRKDISMELCTYMHEQYCDDLISSLQTPVSNIEFVTHMRHEWKCLTWDVGDEKSWKMCKIPFIRVIPLEEVYPGEMVITFDFEKRDDEEWLKLCAEFTGFNAMKPLLLDGEIFFVSKGVVLLSRKFNYLLETREEWHFPQLVKRSDLLPNERNTKNIEIRLCICDGNLPTRQVSSNINNASSFREVKDLRKLMTDLSKSSYEKDLKLKIGDHLYDVHSTMLVARSPKFKELVQNGDWTIEIDEYMSKEASESFIRHLYGDNLLDLDISNIVSLYRVARKFYLTSLEKKTKRMLRDWMFRR